MLQKFLKFFPKLHFIFRKVLLRSKKISNKVGGCCVWRCIYSSCGIVSSTKYY